MGWFDDLKVRAEQSVDSAIKDINSYIDNRTVDQVVKIAEEAKGNLNALQLAAGQYGGSVAPAQPKASASETANAAQASQFIVAGVPVTTLVMIAAGAYFLFAKKGRG